MPRSGGFFVRKPLIVAKQSLRLVTEDNLGTAAMDHERDRYSPSDGPPVEDRPGKRRRISARLAREVGLMRSPRDKFTGFVGSASGIFFIRSVYGAIDRTQPKYAAAADTPGSDMVPGEDDHLPLVQPNSSERLWEESEIKFELPSHISFQDLVALSGSYFANWHPFYPFLHAPTVLQYFDELARNPIAEKQPFGELEMVILRSVMSTSLADHRQDQGAGGVQYPAHLVFRTYDAAVDSLQPVLSRPTSILAIQAALSVQIFLISMLRLNAASRLGGLIVRMAVQLGLHRCPARFSSFSQCERELRQRIFWSIYAMDRFLSQSMGIPLSLQDNDVDVCFPITEHHLSSPPRPGSNLHLSHLLAQQSRLRGEIIELRNKSLHHVQNDPDRPTAITAKLSQWWNDVENYIDPDGPYKASKYAATILTLLRHESIISFYRPVLAASRKDAAYDEALQQCISSARSIISNLYSVVHSHDSQGQAARGSLVLLWPSCTWAVWISTFIMFYAANGSHITRNVVIRLADKSLDILQHLSRRGSAWPEASSAAIRDLRARMTQPMQSARDNDLSRDAVTEVPASAPENQFLCSFIQQDVAPAYHDAYHQKMSHSTDFAGTSDPIHGSSGDATVLGFDDHSWDAFVGTGEAGNMITGDPAGLDPFSGFDIPFWFDQEQYWDFSQ